MWHCFTVFLYWYCLWSGAAGYDADLHAQVSQKIRTALDQAKKNMSESELNLFASAHAQLYSCESAVIPEKPHDLSRIEMIYSDLLDTDYSDANPFVHSAVALMRAMRNEKVPTVIWHVGTMKTASSSFQFRLKSNLAALSSRGWIFMHKVGAFQRYIRAKLCNATETESLPHNSPEHEFHQFLTHLEGGGSAVLSDEDTIGRDGTLRCFQEYLKSRNPETAVFIVGVSRDAPALAVSLWAQMAYERIAFESNPSKWGLNAPRPLCKYLEQSKRSVSADLMWSPNKFPGMAKQVLPGNHFLLLSYDGLYLAEMSLFRFIFCFLGHFRCSSEEEDQGVNDDSEIMGILDDAILHRNARKPLICLDFAATLMRQANTRPGCSPNIETFSLKGDFNASICSAGNDSVISLISSALKQQGKCIPCRTASLADFRAEEDALRRSFNISLPLLTPLHHSPDSDSDLLADWCSVDRSLLEATSPSPWRRILWNEYTSCA